MNRTVFSSLIKPSVQGIIHKFNLCFLNQSLDLAAVICQQIRDDHHQILGCFQQLIQSFQNYFFEIFGSISRQIKNKSNKNSLSDILHIIKGKLASEIPKIIFDQSPQEDDNEQLEYIDVAQQGKLLQKFSSNQAILQLNQPNYFEDIIQVQQKEKQIQLNSFSSCIDPIFSELVDQIKEIIQGLSNCQLQNYNLLNDLKFDLLLTQQNGMQKLSQHIKNIYKIQEPFQQIPVKNFNNDEKNVGLEEEAQDQYNNYFGELRKKKKKKKKIQDCPQQKIIIQSSYYNTQQKKMTKIQQMIIAQILLMKEKLSSTRIYKSQKTNRLKQLWFWQLDKDQIIKKVLQIAKKQLFTFYKEILRMKKLVDKRCQNIQQICPIHERRVYYKCLNQRNKMHIYLCNGCIQEIKGQSWEFSLYPEVQIFYDTIILQTISFYQLYERLNIEEYFKVKEKVQVTKVRRDQQITQNNKNHQNHQIICQKHKMPINYKKTKESYWHITQKDVDIQLYLCQSCVYVQKADEILLISHCHFDPITQLCVQRQCIKNDQFRFCQVCTHKFQNHKTIRFSQKALMEYFNINQDLDIRNIEAQFIDIRQKLKLNPIIKIIDSYLKDIWHILKLLQSFAINNNAQLKKWINCVLKQVQKDDMLVLWGVGELKRRSFNEQDRGIYLETFNDLLKKQLQILFKQISEPLKWFRKRLETFTELDKQNVNSTVSNKYSEIINIEFHDKSIVQPFYLYQMLPNNLYQVKKILIKKEREETNEQMIAIRQRDQRSKYFKQQIKQQLYSQLIGKQSREMIYEHFIEINYNRQSDSSGFDPYPSLQVYKQQIEKIQTRLKKIKQQFQLKQKECLPLSFIISQQKLVNLKIIHIQYAQADLQDQFSKRLRYSISAFQLFKALQFNQQLDQVTINGVEIEYFQKFIQIIYDINHNQSICSQDTVWIKKFNPRPSLKLSLDAILFFKIVDKNQLCAKIKYLLFFQEQFQQLSDLTIQIRLGKMKIIRQWSDNLVTLFDCLKQIKRIKLVIGKKAIEIDQEYQDMMFQGDNVLVQSIKILRQSLFQKIASFTLISRLQFYDIFLIVQTEQDKDEIIEIQKHLSIIFQNNKISHYKLFNCKNFPIIPSTTTLISIRLEFVIFRKQFNLINQLLKENPLLKSLICFRLPWKSCLNQQLINRLQNLTINTCNKFQLDDDLTEKPSSIKNLQIINSNSFRPPRHIARLFPKLTNLVYLYLSDISFGYSTLSTIPSVHLKQFHTLSNKLITDKDVQLVDQKWPYLTNITLTLCQQLTSSIFNTCKFKGLISLRIQACKIKKGDMIMHNLKTRGIKVHK